jgi:hypothetical protein
MRKQFEMSDQNSCTNKARSSSVRNSRLVPNEDCYEQIQTALQEANIMERER